MSVKDNWTYYEHYFVIDDKVQVAKRIRYNMWMALSDLGGLNDGIYVVFGFIIAPIAATAFENELISKNIFASQLSARDRQKRNNLAKVFADGAHYDLTEGRINNLIGLMQKLKAVRVSFCESILDCLKRSFKRRRRQKVIRRLLERYMKQLDIRVIIANSLAFQDFTHCFLSKPQQTLLSHQRSRISVDFSSNSGEDNNNDDPLRDISFTSLKE